LNRNFNLVQQPGETPEDYVARIRSQTEAIDDPNLVVDRFNLQEARDFKQNMKEIIRDTSVIEEAYNTLFQESDALIPEINKIFQLIKSRYQKTYGDYQLKAVDLIKFLKQLVESPEETIRRVDEEEPDVDFTDKFVAVNKSKRYTVPELVIALVNLKDYFGESFAVSVQGRPAVLEKGDRGGLTVTYGTATKNISQANKSILVSLYIGLLEKIKRENPGVYAKLNADVNRKTGGDYGEGLGKTKLGAIHIDLDKLFYKNILSLTQNGAKIIGLKNVPVSEEMVKLLIDLTKGTYPTSRELNKLSPLENQIFDALLHVAKMHKKVENTAPKSVSELKKRASLIGGEIEAGNTNRELRDELRDVVYKLHHLGEITQNSATSYLKQF
jgi:phage terminase Nu1 subunit (DNA packaging protein)